MACCTSGSPAAIFSSKSSIPYPLLGQSSIGLLAALPPHSASSIGLTLSDSKAPRMLSIFSHPTANAWHNRENSTREAHPSRVQIGRDWMGSGYAFSAWTRFQIFLDNRSAAIPVAAHCEHPLRFTMDSLNSGGGVPFLAS